MTNQQYLLGTYLELDLRTKERKFFVPSDKDFAALKVGDKVEVIFQSPDFKIEKLEVVLTRVNFYEDGPAYSFSGTVVNPPQVLNSPKKEELVNFGSKSISNIYPH